ncbi:hypothetical protein FNF27_00917 [Cafeteria roenbergensis]|uniref:Bromo domain-containing protein n=1 Tax=Cafeteria roenbergensis TaxID=33653 RepID=A0A5A8EIQ3_CAFRO|nr:hypothetical protein FNF27_00917 [Cafeteria roenbergensis]
MADRDAASGAAAAADGRPKYIFGEKGRAFLATVPLGGLANAAASVRLGLPEWEALIPLLSELGADLSAVYAAVAVAQADMLRTRATEAPRAAVEDVLRQVLEARSETLLPLAAAVIRRLGVDSLPRDIIDLAGEYNKLPAVLDDASKRALLARSKASFLGHVRDELARFLGSSMNAVARFCVVNFNVGLEPGSKMSRTVDEIASACASAGPQFASEALDMMVDIHMHSGFRALAAIRAAVGARLSRKHAHVDQLAALCRACHGIIMAKDVNPTSLKAVMDALQVLVSAREAGLRRKAQEQARAAVATKSSSGGRKPAFSASVDSLGAAVRESCKLVRRRVDKHGHYFAPVTTLWPQLKDTYTLKVPTPMDFGTIARKSDSYATKAEAEADARLVYQNSELFNGRQHQITVAARRCTDEFIKALGPLAREAENKQQLAEAASEAHAEAVRIAGPESRKLPATDSVAAAAAAAAAEAKPRDSLAEADAQVSDAAFLVDIWFPRLLDRLTTVPPSAASLAAGATSAQLVVPDHLIAMCHDRAASFLVLLLDAGDSVKDALRSRVRHFLELFVKAASSDGWARGSRYPEPVTDDTVACAAQPAFDGPLMTSARQQYDRLCLALSLDRLPLGLRNPMPLA